MSDTLNAFAGFPLDKAGGRRRDAAWLKAALVSDEARITAFQRLQPLIDPGGGASPLAAAVWLGPAAASLADAGAPALFLGVDADGAPHFAVSLPDRFDVDDSPLAGLGSFQDMRAAAMTLPAAEASVLGCAKALFEWHASHGHCARCGAASTVVDGGWKRVCSACAAEHFPRVDPVVIMLPVLGARCCVGRQARFPAGMFSALAGFVEPGESLEEACRREIFEEVGLTATRVRYVSSQPWPFPSQMMIGLIADVSDDALTLDREEIDEAVWLTREEARRALAGGVELDGRRVWAPPPIAIAHHLMLDWVNEG